MNAKRTHRRIERSSNRRGSVLVFAVVVLAILAMVSTAFLIVVRHAIMASKAGVNYTQPDTAVDAGTIRANRVLRLAMQRNTITSPNGVIGFGSFSDPLVLNVPGDCMQLLQPGEALANGGTAKVGDALHSGPDYLTPLNYFEHDPTFENQKNIRYPSFAVLSSQFPHTVNNTVIQTPFYTSAPLRISAGVGTADWATPYYMRSSFTEFYNGDTAIGATLKKYRQIGGSIGTIRGRHFVWVRDLDACFYGIPAMWGLRAPQNVAGGTYSAAEQTVALGILEYLRHTPGSEMMANPPLILKDTWQLPDMQNMAALPIKSYAHIGDVAFALQSQRTISDPTLYENWRADIENYFTTTLDASYTNTGTVVTNSLGQAVTAFKPTAAAININTAPEEVIQAMLSQIPCWDPLNKVEKKFELYRPQGIVVIPTGAPAPCLAELVAKRIVAKRPFLSRMDFEDFAASLLPYDNTVPNVMTPLTNNLNTELGLLMYAMNKRIDGEISLGQFMDMPTLPNGNYGNGDVNPYVGANTRQGMLNRFAFFLADDSSRAYYDRKDCMLSVKAFNNLLNSVSSSPGINFYNYRQMIPAGTSGAPNAPEIIAAAGVTGTLAFDTLQLGGDDQYIRDANNVITGINTGANGVAETQISGFSYYSHDFGGRFINEYKPYRLKDDPAFANVDFTSPKDCGKFVFGDPNQQYVPVNMQPLPPGSKDGYRNYFIQDLQKWSCIGDGKLSGYYDMFFNPLDGMKHEFGEHVVAIPPQQLTDADLIAVEAVGSTSGQKGLALRTGLLSDDIQEVDYGDPVDELNYVVVLPGPVWMPPAGPPTMRPPSYNAIETEPNKNNSVLAAGAGQPQQPMGNDVVVNAIRYGLTMPDPPMNNDGVHTITGDFLYLASDGNTYIVPAYGTTTLLSSKRPDPNDGFTDSNDVDELVQVIVDSGLPNPTGNKSDTQIANDDVFDPDQNRFTIGPNQVQETTVWGPIRACQRSQDVPSPIFPLLNADQIPTSNLNSGVAGDVAWSPGICFRSRYYATYVLAEGMLTQAIVGNAGAVVYSPANPVNQVAFAPADKAQVSNIVAGAYFAVNSAPVDANGVAIAGAPMVQHVYTIEAYNGSTLTLSSPLVATINAGDYGAVYTAKKIGERRVESIYDAYTDTVIWTRSPLTDKRTLGDQ